MNVLIKTVVTLIVVTTASSAHAAMPRLLQAGIRRLAPTMAEARGVFIAACRDVVASRTMLPAAGAGFATGARPARASVPAPTWEVSEKFINDQIQRFIGDIPALPREVVDEHLNHLNEGIKLYDSGAITMAPLFTRITPQGVRQDDEASYYYLFPASFQKIHHNMVTRVFINLLGCSPQADLLGKGDRGVELVSSEAFAKRCSYIIDERMHRELCLYELKILIKVMRGHLLAVEKPSQVVKRMA